MKKLTLVFAFFLTLYSYSQTHLYEHPDVDDIISTHKTIGILPFITTINLRPKQLKDFTLEQLDVMQKAEGRSIQSAMHSWYLKRNKRGSFDITVQVPRKTNTLLKRAGITVENIEDYLPEEIAKILGVDGLIMGDFVTSKPMSEAGAIAGIFLFGLAGSANKATINLNVYNGADGELLVNYNKTVRGGLGSSVEDLINKIMRKSSRRISYTKSNKL